MSTQRSELLIELNEQLASLSEAGVVIDLGLPPGQVRPALERLNVVLARNAGTVTQDQEAAWIDSALSDDQANLPEAYRRFIDEWRSGADLTALLDRRWRSARAEATKRRVYRAGFFYPLFVALLASFGLIFFCSHLLPTINAFYADLRIEGGPGIGWLRYLGATMPYWGIAVPLLLIVVYWMASRGRFLASGREAKLRRLARASETTADLLDAGVPLDKATQSAFCVASKSVGQRPEDNSTPVTRDAPLLSWAADGKRSSTARPEELRCVANVYEQLSSRRTQRTRRIAPTLACVFIGGGATLLYGLALFIPFTEMLRALAY